MIITILIKNLLYVLLVFELFTSLANINLYIFLLTKKNYIIIIMHFKNI